MSNLVYLRIDTTGTDLTSDRIVGIHARKVTQKERIDFNRYILPAGDWKMNPEASEKNGLTEEYIRANGEDPVTVFNDFNNFISEPTGTDLITFGGLNFDMRFLGAAYNRYGLQFNAIHHRMYDMHDIEVRNNSNNFTSTYQRHCGKPVETKTIDTMEELFWKMSTDYTREQILGEYKPMIFDLDGLYRQDSTGQLKFTRGKHSGEYVYDVIRNHPDYILFLFKNVVSPQSKQIIINEYERLKKSTEIECLSCEK